ncbi:hypothetical protein FJZ31_17145 [Candidatus Poribacteria bacterium]|nr:hypothetical protein [Candidatus Poribacteria bacterium]
MMDYNVPRSERRPFSNELLAEIHIKLDKQGVEGLDEKEMMVLLTEEVSDSTYRLDNISRMTNEISTKIDHTAERLDTSIALAAKQIIMRIEPVAEQVGEIHHIVKKIDVKIDTISDTTQQISEKMDNLGEKMDNISEKIGNISTKIDESVTPLKEEIIKFRRTISLSAKLIVSGLWAVVASLIASLIFKACGG